MKPKISIIDDCKLKIESFSCAALGDVPETVIDLDAHAGEYVHIWIDKDGAYSLDPGHDHYWHIAELPVPERRFRIDAEEIIQDGETQIRENPVPLPVKLSIAEMVMRELPE